MNKRVIIIGAGKTGRGFIGRLIGENENIALIFVDQDEALIQKLRNNGGYQIFFYGEKREPAAITGYEAYTWEEAKKSGVFAQQADAIFVSVGGQNLEAVGKSLAEVLNTNEKVCVITAENASHPAQTLKESICNASQELDADKLFVSESTVFCTTNQKAEVDILSENYPYMQSNADLLAGLDPELPNIRLIRGFSDFLTRKLYTYNAASCVIAYLGWLKGYEIYAEAANDPEINKKLDQNYEQTNEAMCLEYGYEKEDQKSFALLSKEKFCDFSIVDTVERNGRDPKRKLKAGERIIGPAKLMLKYGLDASVLAETAAAGIAYSIYLEKEEKTEGTVKQYLEQICGLEQEDPLYKAILDRFPY